MPTIMTVHMVKMKRTWLSVHGAICGAIIMPMSGAGAFIWWANQST